MAGVESLSFVPEQSPNVNIVCLCSYRGLDKMAHSSPEIIPIPAEGTHEPDEVNQPDLAKIPPAECPEKATKDIYFVSGLGADERVFQLLKIEGYRPIHIRWIEPHRSEPIEQYAQRLSAQIVSNKPIIIGLSFGGLIAIEIAKHLPVEKVILISSAKTSAEIPPYFKIFRWFPIHRIFPLKQLLNFTYGLVCWLFSLESTNECQMLRGILTDTDARFLRWALHQVVIWRNAVIPDGAYHVHGTSDRIFPRFFVKPDYSLEAGGHFMVMNRATQISALLERIMS